MCLCFCVALSLCLLHWAPRVTGFCAECFAYLYILGLFQLQVVAECGMSGAVGVVIMGMNSCGYGWVFAVWQSYFISPSQN